MDDADDISKDDELSNYLLLPRTADDDDVCKFWRKNVLCFPGLSIIARNILAIPATSISSERVFSLAGRTLEERRSSLSPKSVDSLLFLKSNYQLLSEDKITSVLSKD